MELLVMRSLIITAIIGDVFRGFPLLDPER